jgi:NADH-quinone oxidoreductase subunit L
MLGLIISNNLLMLFMCWELVGLCSYLLIGFFFYKDSAANAAKKAFITTRIGDIGFFIGILWLYMKSGTLLFYDNGAGILEDANVAKLAAENMSFFGVYMSVSSAIAICLFIGAMGKSAQFPLHVWLPDAMEGPTPVSALIHAATMVAAGVFMVGRMYPIFDASMVDGQLVHAMTQAHPHPTPALSFVMWVGAITAVFAATIGVAQNDIKRVLAYSTCSQLGFMMMGLGAVGFVAGMFHLITHAFFKALLFLGSGAVIHGCHHEQDMAKMGGLKKLMPITFVTYLIGMLALIGAPLTSGFFSKDEILLAAFHTNKIVFAMGVFGAFLTAFYMTRQMYMVFAGEYRGGDSHGHDAHAHDAHGAHDKHDDHSHGHGHTPHEVPKNMWMPLAALAVFALLLGFLGTPFIGGNLWHHYLAPESPAHDVSWLVMGVATGAGLIGFLLSRAIYSKQAVLADGSDPLQAKLGGLWELLKNKWYVDELYEATVVKLNWIFAAWFRGVDACIDWTLHAISWVTIGISQLWRWVGDEFLINGGVDTLSEGVRGTGSGFSSVQSGKVQNYLRIIGWGAVGLVVVVLVLTKEHWEKLLGK